MLIHKKYCLMPLFKHVQAQNTLVLSMQTLIKALADISNKAGDLNFSSYFVYVNGSNEGSGKS